MEKWKAWPYLVDLLEILQKEHEVIIVKARQLGVSWLLSGYGLHKALFGEASKVLCLSQGEEEAWGLISKSHFIWSKLPDFLRIPITHDSKAWMEFSTSSEIQALPSTEKAGRGTDATLVIRDELAKHPYGADNYTAISPAVDSGGQLVDLSTINKTDSHNHFTERIIRAREGAVRRELKSGLIVHSGGTSGATLVFAGWKLRPVRQEGMTLDEWFETRIRSKYSPFQIEQEYPETLEEALKPSSTVCFFDVKALDDMMLQIDSPKPYEGLDNFNGMVRYYKPPIPGRQYVIFTDPSNGIADPFVTVVMDTVTGEWVCTATGKIVAQEVARIHDYLVREYNKAYNTGEANAQAGGSFIDTLVLLETPNIAPRRSAEGKIIHDRKGWYTQPALRDVVIHDYREAIRKQLVTIHDREAIEEHRRFIRQEDGKIKASGKGHDDWVMAGAGAWTLNKYVPRGDYKITSTKYGE